MEKYSYEYDGSKYAISFTDKEGQKRTVTWVPDKETAEDIVTNLNSHLKENGSEG